ncbi:glutamate racemase [Atopobium fossor]|uniref:glutamate racemase n=1 Tax=Atopobium fossor TaxID=39487 RepID=UPI0004142027|nr:glutamate racemase [Atopobium fossor]
MLQPSLPIGVFDSGLGGLTVARALSDCLPDESIWYVGDTKRCPYGPRSQDEVRTFALQVGKWLAKHDIKLMVIACNTATAAAFHTLQKELPVPVIGVIEPGARAAIMASRSRKIGVLATQGTVASNSYVHALHFLDVGVEVTQCAAPRFVQKVEDELANGGHLHQDWKQNPEIFDTPQVHAMVQKDVTPLMNKGIDTVVLGCTHFPLLSTQIQAACADGVRIVNPAEETAREVKETLKRRGLLAGMHDATRGVHAEPTYRFATTSDDITSFAVAGKFVFGHDLDSVEHIELSELETL